MLVEQDAARVLDGQQLVELAGLVRVLAQHRELPLQLLHSAAEETAVRSQRGLRLDHPPYAVAQRQQLPLASSECSAGDRQSLLQLRKAVVDPSAARSARKLRGPIIVWPVVLDILDILPEPAALRLRRLHPLRQLAK